MGFAESEDKVKVIWRILVITELSERASFEAQSQTETVRAVGEF